MEQAEPWPGRRLRAAVPSGVSEKTSLLWPQTKLLPSIRPTYLPTIITEQSHVLQAGFLWQTVALSTSHALVFVGADRKEKWRRDPTYQLPACSKSHERVPRAEGNLAFKSQGNTVPRSSRRRDLACYLHRGPARPGKRIGSLAALSGSTWMYLVFTCPSPDVTARGIRHPCFFTNLRGATLMGIYRILLGKGLVSSGDAFWWQCLVTDKIINGGGGRGIFYTKGWKGSGDVGSCW